VPHVFFQSHTDCLFSITDMFLNTFSLLEKDKHIVFFCTADHILDPNFFETLVRNFEPMSGGTSFPHLEFNNPDDCKNGRQLDEYYKKPVKYFFEYDPNLHLPECFYFDGNIFLNPEVQEWWRKHPVHGTFPGIGLSLYIGFWAPKLYNLFYQTKINKIGNNTEIYQDSHGNTPDMIKNEKVIREFAELRGIDKKLIYGTTFLSRKWLMHHKYRVKGSLVQKLFYELYFFYYALRPRKVWLPTKLFQSGMRFLGGQQQRTRSTR